MNRSFNQSQRLRKTSEFRALYRYGKYEEQCGIRIYILICPEIISKRIGIVVPKRCGKAFQRNRIKRYVREWFRHQQGQFPLGIGLVVQIKSASWNKVSYGEFLETLNRIVDAILSR